MLGPDAGDVVWLSFSPHAGREQAGRRPALILSPARYNRRAGLAFACPIASQRKGYPFEVVVEGIAGVRGVVLVDHLRSVDWRARSADPIGRVPTVVMDEVLAKLRALLGV